MAVPKPQVLLQKLVPAASPSVPSQKSWQRAAGCREVKSETHFKISLELSDPKDLAPDAQAWCPNEYLKAWVTGPLRHNCPGMRHQGVQPPRDPSLAIELSDMPP